MFGRLKFVNHRLLELNFYGRNCACLSIYLLYLPYYFVLFIGVIVSAGCLIVLLSIGAYVKLYKKKVLQLERTHSINSDDHS